MSDEDLRDDPLADYQRDLKGANREALRRLRDRERLVQRAIEDAEKRAWIEAGNETRQPPEYRGRVWDTEDRDGVHPTAYPPLRESAGGELTEEFIAFQAHNQTRYETHPQYYCVTCKIRYNARDGGECGPCLGARMPSQGPMSGSRSRSAPSTPPVYPT